MPVSRVPGFQAQRRQEVFRVVQQCGPQLDQRVRFNGERGTRRPWYSPDRTPKPTGKRRGGKATGSRCCFDHHDVVRDPRNPSIALDEGGPPGGQCGVGQQGTVGRDVFEQDAMRTGRGSVDRFQNHCRGESSNLQASSMRSGVDAERATRHHAHAGTAQLTPDASRKR